MKLQASKRLMATETEVARPNLRTGTIEELQRYEDFLDDKIDKLEDDLAKREEAGEDDDPKLRSKFRADTKRFFAMRDESAKYHWRIKELKKKAAGPSEAEVKFKKILALINKTFPKIFKLSRAGKLDLKYDLQQLIHMIKENRPRVLDRDDRHTVWGMLRFFKANGYAQDVDDSSGYTPDFFRAMLGDKIVDLILQS